MAMTEIDFSRDICPDVRRFATDADADKATQVNIPHWAKKVTIRPEGSKVRLAFTSSDDDIHSDYIKLSADTPSEFEFWGGHNRPNVVTAIYISNKAAYAFATNVSIMIEGTDK